MFAEERNRVECAGLPNEGRSKHKLHIIFFSDGKGMTALA
jgi:hypothetical protein